MSTLAIAVCLMLLGSLVAQNALAAGFVGTLRTRRRPSVLDAGCPRVAIVLCLRGHDPYLNSTLNAVLAQDYPAYELHVVVDSEHDSAWPAVRQAIQDNPATTAQQVLVATLSQRLSTCSLKCSALVQTIERFEPGIEVVALLDADTVPHATWLRELVTPMIECPDVGATTGNRWYMPPQGNWGSLVRYLWNAAAVVQMYWYSIAWGGTVAVRTQVIRQTGLLDRWRAAYCEDTMLYRALSAHGYRVKFVPSLMMINRETCSLPDFCRWMERQLLAARLYHPHFPLVLIHGVMTSVLLAAALVLGVEAFSRSDSTVGWWALGTWIVSELLLIPPLLAMEMAVRRIAAERHEPTRWLSLATLLRLPLAMIVTQVVYPMVLISACLLRRVIWRGVHYDVSRTGRIQLVQDVSGGRVETWEHQ